MDRDKILSHNRAAWNSLVETGNPWTIPVSREEIAAARKGQWQIVLTPIKPVPSAWFPALDGLDVLCLASGGGQQGPILAAAGARVTVFDNSPAQLDRDRMVAEREGLDISLVQGDMADLSAFDDESFGLIIHPVSNLFVPDVRPVWKEAFRVMRKQGVMLVGLVNPCAYLFDEDEIERTDKLEVRYTLPYADTDVFSAESLKEFVTEGRPLEFGHSLEDQIGGQLDAGFVLNGFYEDRRPETDNDLLSRHMPVFIATRAMKP